jgi:DNA-binding NarL/FixJ family response regulator
MSTDALSDLRSSLIELAHESPLMLVVEDMHWADRSTQDAAVMLAHTMRGPFVLVLTYRGEDVTRQHPFRRSLADIGRGPGARRIDLGSLDEAAIAEIVETVIGAADPRLTSSILERSGGNPLFAEELLAASDEGLPEYLNALLLARIDALTPTTRSLIRLASVGGRRIETTLLSQASRLSEREVDAGLGEALDANVVSRSGGHLRFRHDLVREAAYQDLLPDERVAAHLAFAGALQSRLESDVSPSIADLAAVAFHWSEGGETSRAFVAHLHAGMSILRYGAPESTSHLERVLDLWAVVPDPETLGGVAHPEVLRLLADAAEDHGDYVRSDRYLLAALRALDDDTDPLVASRVYSSYGEHNKQLDDDLEQPKALEMAVAIVDGTPSKELSMALAHLSERTQWLRSTELGLTLARRAVEVAVAAQCPAEQAYGMWAVADALWEHGRCRDALRQYDLAAQAADEAGATGWALNIRADHAYFTLSIGDIARASAVAEAGRARAVSLGLPDAAVLHGEQLIEAFLDTGDFDRAERLLEESRTTGMHEHRWRMMRIQLLLARGDRNAAAPLVLDGIARLETGARSHPTEIANYVDVFGPLGRINEVLPSAEAHLVDRFQHPSPLALAQAACTAYTALGYAASSGVEAPEGLREGAERALAQALDRMSDDWSATFRGSEALLAQALARSLDGDPAVPEWRAAAAAADRHGAYRALGPRVGLARAVLADGDRTEAAELLLDVWQSAQRLGARGLENEAADIARRSRIALPGLEDLPPRLAALTPREREVLGLLATGATNRVIAERLFISEKTASVHVSRILNKLAVPNRGAAAALARDLAR